jgi:integrase
MAMMQVLKRMGHGDVTTHGFRSSFKDWSRERINFPNEVSELALAHQVGSETERAYARGDLLQKRYQLAEAWARYCLSPPLPAGESVVSLHA